VVRARLAAALVVAAAVGAVVAVLAVEQGWWSGSPGTPPREAVSVEAVLSPPAVHFGDTLNAHAVVVLDPARIDVASVRLEPRFLSYRVAGATRREQRDGAATTLTYDLALECLGAGCAPGRPQVALQFPTALLRYRTRDGAAGRATVRWPEVTVASRLDDEDRANPYARFRADTSPPPASYDVSPDTLQDGLVAGAALLVLAAAALLWLAFRRRRAAPATAGTRVAPGDPLEEALRLVREIAADGHRPELRRLALQRLVTELRASGRDELADSAGRLAWAGGPPSPKGASELADRVEREVAEP
jgi:hypothetical protein